MTDKEYNRIQMDVIKHLNDEPCKVRWGEYKDYIGVTPDCAVLYLIPQSKWVLKLDDSMRMSMKVLFDRFDESKIANPVYMKDQEGKVVQVLKKSNDDAEIGYYVNLRKLFPKIILYRATSPTNAIYITDADESPIGLIIPMRLNNGK